MTTTSGIVAASPARVRLDGRGARGLRSPEGGMRIVRTLLLGAVASLVVSCGGKVGPQGNTDAATDKATGGGDGASDHPVDGGAGDKAGDAGGDASGDDGGGMRGHPLGTSCLLATEC